MASLVLAAFPLLFVGFWLAITTLLNFLSGCWQLAETFPDDHGDPVKKRMRFNSPP